MTQNKITAELYEFIVKVVEDKVKEIRVTREEFDKIDCHKQTRGSQARTEERLQKLAEAQQRTEERLNQLATTVEKLAVAVDDLKREVGRLSETVGFGL